MNSELELEELKKRVVRLEKWSEEFEQALARLPDDLRAAFEESAVD